MKFLTTIFFCSLSLFVGAQAVQPTVPAVQPYGKVDMADLEMKSCDFEPDANAEILFDKANVIASGTLNNIMLERHVRIKIFNDFGKNAANVKIQMDGRAIGAFALEAETINQNNGKIEIIPVDKKSIYTQKIDKWLSEKSFTFPDVKPGSIVEYKYSIYYVYFPVWSFQANVPTRYSEIETVFAAGQDLKVIPHVKQPFVINKGFNDDNKQVKTLANVHSLPDEQYMSGRLDNLQRLEFLAFKGVPPTWLSVGHDFSRASDFGWQFGRNIAGEEEILDHAKKLKTADEKIAFIFDEVKNKMKWNDLLTFYSIEGTTAAWDKKTGNSAEINMIVYHLLKKAGINVFPLIIGGNKIGKINPTIPGPYHFSTTDVYIPIDSSKYYVLDASNKYNLFNAIPKAALNSYGLFFDEKDNDYHPIFLEDTDPAIQSVFLNAEISGDGKMSGTLERTSYAYHKINALKNYKPDGEEKYIKFLCDSNNNIKLQAVKLKDMEVDSLPLTLNANFNVDLGGVTEGYIYFKTNLFMTMGPNPFLSENRFSDIDFGYRDNYSVNGIYKIPEGYKIDALPKSVTIVMPDRSIIFKRTVAEDNGTIVIRYMLDHKKSLYFSEDYPDIKDFYKKMYEVLNEQVVLKKI